MRRFPILIGCAVVASSASCGVNNPLAPPSAQPSADASADAAPVTQPDDLNDVLEPVRAKHGLPSLAVAAWVGDALVGEGAVGVRKVGDATPVTKQDKWHLGSDTKAMTATLAAMLVDAKKVQFSSTLKKLFPSDTVNELYQQVTLDMLFMHRSGAPANPPDALWSKMWADSRSFEVRRDVVLSVIKDAPPNPVGEYLYANTGYMIAGASLEKTTGQTWEDMMHAMIFGPLGMASCGFGAPSTVNTVDQPWGHESKGGEYLPVKPGHAADNPPSLGPAGTVNCSLADWGKFLRVHLHGSRGEATIVSGDALKHLQTPPRGGDYALGWGVESRSWAGGTVLTHSGSNTMFLATVWIAPAKNLIMVAATNAADAEAENGIDEAFAPLIERYAK